MSGIQYNLQFEKLCKSLQLGELVGVPEPISGGLLHRMYAIQTTQGKYAIKALNPQIMHRPTALQNFIRSERVANIAANHIPALPAHKFGGTSVNEIDKQFYLVFDWVDGIRLKPHEVSKEHCEKISAILANLHMADFSELGRDENGAKNAKTRDWNFYLEKGQENHAGWVDMLMEVIDKLYAWNAMANHSAKLLSSDRVISHGDLNPKNVMWNQGSPVIIDWESAGYINPVHDLVETAIYWSQNEQGNMDKERFIAFIGGYQKRFGILQADWEIVLNHGFLSKLGWLEYNLKRSLRIECADEKEQQMGSKQVTGTIHRIRRYADTISELEKWLKNEI